MAGMTSRERLETDRQDRSLANKNALWLKRHRQQAALRRIRYSSSKTKGGSMKKLFLGSLVALGLGTPAAFAAERAVPAYTPPPPPPPAYTWTGCYVGASAGYSGGTSQHFTTAGSIFTRAGDGPYFACRVPS